VLLVEDNRLLRDTCVYSARQYFDRRRGTIVLYEALDVESTWRMVQKTDYVLVLVDYFSSAQPKSIAPCTHPGLWNGARGHPNRSAECRRLAATTASFTAGADRVAASGEVVAGDRGHLHIEPG
jgi:hypothetical protein